MPDYKLRIIVEGEDHASGPLGNVAGSLGRIGEFAAGSLLADGIKKTFDGSLKLAGGFLNVTKEAGDLNAQLQVAASNSEATATELAALKDLVYDLGIDPNLQVTATEAAESINMLVRNGLDLQTVMDGAAESTVLLANSTGAEFGQSADIATDAMSIFGIAAEDMGQAVNGITGVVNNSKFSIADYQLALAQGGAAAAVAGISFEEFNAVVAALAPNFASGSDAGTSFKTMVQRLVPQSKEATSAMNALGLEFFDADGSMKSMTDVAAELNRVFEGQVNFTQQVGGRTADQNDELDRLNKTYNNTLNSITDYQAGIKGVNLSEEERADKVAELQTKLEAVNGERQKLLAIQGDLVTTTRALTEEEKIQYLQTIFGTDAMRAAAAMAGYTEEELAALMKTIGETDALRSAATRMDSLAGDMEIFGGVVETVRLQVGDKFQPAARAFTQGLTGILEAASPALVATADGLSDILTPRIEAFAANIKTSVDAAKAAFSDAGGGYEGAAAGLEAFTGGALTVEIIPTVGKTVDPGEIFGFVIDGNSFHFSVIPEVGTRLNIGDIFAFATSGDNATLRIADLIDFSIKDDEFNKLTLADTITFLNDDGTLAVNIEWGKMFEFDRSQIGKVTLGDVFPFMESDQEIFDITKMFTFDPKSIGTVSAEELFPFLGEGGVDLSGVFNTDGFTWPELPTFEWPTFPAWSWPTLPSFSWPTLPTWSWPAFPSFSWPAIPRPTWEWPGIPRPGWLDEVGGALGAILGRSIGDASWRGGLVNVHRDEVIGLPRGTRIYNPTEAAQLAGAGAGVSIGNVTINNDMDMAEFEERLSRIMGRYR